MNEPICPHCGGGPSDEQHQRECEEDTVLYQQQATIVTLERQLAEARKDEHDTVLALKRLQNERDAALEALEEVIMRGVRLWWWAIPWKNAALEHEYRLGRAVEALEALKMLRMLAVAAEAGNVVLDDTRAVGKTLPKHIREITDAILNGESG